MYATQFSPTMTLTLACCLILSKLSMGSEKTIAKDARPNIVVFLCDDLGYGDLECYGHPHIKTPNLNGLATSGIRFTDCYSAAPVCSPSRVGLLTGRSPNRAGVYDWIPPAKQPKPDLRDLVHMRSSEITIANLLQKAGYDTCLAGKWHCNSRFNSKLQPQPSDHGFDHWLATQNNASPSHQNPRNFVRNGQPVGRVEDFSCQYVVKEAISWLETRDGNEPFFLFIPFHEPHEPVASPAKLVEEYRDVAATPDEAQFFANVANVDDAVGKLLRTLDIMKQRENTLVLFTSDNGPETLNRYRSANRSYGRPGILRGMKLHTTEAGFRVAGIASWPGTISPNQVLSTPVSSLDFLPTFCALAGTETPDITLDGVDISAFLKSGDTFSRPRPLIWAYFNSLNKEQVAMRDGRWKVLATLNNDGTVKKMQNVTNKTISTVSQAQLTNIQIFDLVSDPGEKNNLTGSGISEEAELKAKIVEAYSELVSNSHAWQR